jgi:hypothetical protein
LGEVIAPEQGAPVHLARGEILNLCNLFDEAIAVHDIAGLAYCFTVPIGIFRPD